MEDHRMRLAVLKELLDNEEFVNGSLLTKDGDVFRVHLEVVAGKSPYLKRIIFAASKDKVGELQIPVPGVSREVLSNIINFMYTGQLEISYSRVGELVETGELLGMPDVIKFCKTFLASNLNDEKCVAVYNFAKQYRFNDLKETAKSYILKRFQHVFPVSSDYLELPEEDLSDILRSDSLIVPGEESVFCAILRWVEKDPANRANTGLPDLLRCVRFGLCTREFFYRDVASNARVSGNEECQSVLLQASEILKDMPPPAGAEDESTRLRSIPLDLRHPFLRPRTPGEVIFVMGGWSARSTTNIIETLDIKSGRWFLSLHTDSIPRAYHGMVWHLGYIYVIGGFDGHQCFNTVRRYDPTGTHAWQEVECMHERRCYVSVAALDGHVYAMGGFDGILRNSSCERYDPDANQWDNVAPMTQVRSDASADALNGKIYVVGGFNGQQVLNTGEYYDPSTDVWTAITDMISPRSGVKLVAYCNQLYVIGGFNGGSRLATVDRYDTLTKQWTPIPSMHSPRSNFATAILDRCIYVIGGFNGLSATSGVECYSHEKNSWQLVTELNLNRSALAACTVGDIPNLHEYTFLGYAPYN